MDSFSNNKKEDEVLILIINESEEKDWEKISSKLNDKKIIKSAKQCRER